MGDLQKLISELETKAAEHAVNSCLSKGEQEKVSHLQMAKQLFAEADRLRNSLDHRPSATAA
jgi:hypothetical protein